VFSGALSVTGGSADVADNAESVFLAAGVSGPFTVTVTATNINSNGVPNIGTATDQDFALVIYNASTCVPFTFAPPTLPDGTVGSPYSQTLTASGGTAPYTWVVFSGSLPTGLSYSSSGDITGTPTTPGVFNFNVQATDSAGCKGSQAYSITVTCPAIAIDQTSLPDGDAGVPYGQTLTASGGTAPYTFTLFSGSLPTGLGLSTSGDITGTPSDGTYNFTVQVSDAYGCTTTQAYTVNINCPAITVNPASLPGGTISQPYSQALSVSGGTGPYTFAVTTGSLPNGLNLTSDTISGAPSGPAGPSIFAITATDTANNCTGIREYSINVVCPAITPSHRDRFQGRS
jgi:hypothetical protein